LEKRTIIIANIEIGTIIATIPVFISLYIINHITLYMIRKATDYRTTPKKNKKSLKPSSGLLIKISLANLTTNLTNNSINILWTTSMTILTQKKNLRKLSRY
jgi:hypothetical protein